MKKRIKKWVIIISGIVFLAVFIIALVDGSPSQQGQTKSPVKRTIPTDIPQTGTLKADQKLKVIAILTVNVDHYKKLWQDGKDALGTTQYDFKSDAIAALNDPTTPAAKFSAYKKSENPVNDNSMVDAMNKADAFYPSNVSDQPLHTWSDDVEQVSVDMGQWVTDATGWQIKAVGDDKLASDANTITQDLATVQKDIDAIGK